MIIECQNCGAKYKINEEKIKSVGGKAKIKCKKCHEIIVINTTGQDNSVPQIIYVVIRNERVELTPQQFVEKYKSNEINDKTLIWYKGLKQWVKLEQDETIKKFLTSQLSESEGQEVPFSETFEDADIYDDEEEKTILEEEKKVDETLEHETEDSEKLISFDSVEKEETPLKSDASSIESENKTEEEEDEENLFEGVETSAVAKEKEKAGKMKWQRRETSVLFSLDDIKDSSEEKQSSSSEGIIDIKSMAIEDGDEVSNLENILTDWSSSSKAEEGGKIEDIIKKDIEKVAVPVVEQKSNKIFYVIIGILILVIAGLTVYIKILDKQSEKEVSQRLKKEPKINQKLIEKNKEIAMLKMQKIKEEKKKQEQKIKKQKEQQAIKTEKKNVSEKQKEEVKTKEETKTVEKNEAKEKKAVKPVQKNTNKVVKKTVQKKKPKVKTVKKVTTKTTVKEVKVNKNEEADKILASLGKKKIANHNSGSKSLPMRLSNTTKFKIMAKYKGKVASCFKRFGQIPGVNFISVKLNIKNNGTVSSVKINTQKVKGTRQENCINAVLKGIVFPQFKKSSDFVFYNYPVQ